MSTFYTTKLFVQKIITESNLNSDVANNQIYWACFCVLNYSLNMDSTIQQKYLFYPKKKVVTSHYVKIYHFCNILLLLSLLKVVIVTSKICGSCFQWFFKTDISKYIQEHIAKNLNIRFSGFYKMRLQKMANDFVHPVE